MQQTRGFPLGKESYASTGSKCSQGEKRTLSFRKALTYNGPHFQEELCAISAGWREHWLAKQVFD